MNLHHTDDSFRGRFYRLIIICLILFIPILANQLNIRNFILHLIIISCVFAILAMSLNLLLGITGQASIAHAGFFGIGAYISALLTMKLNIPFWISLPCAGVGAGIAGILIGIPSLRMRGIHFAIATFAFNELLHLVFYNWKAVTNGSDGIPSIPAPNPIPIPFLGEVEFSNKLIYAYFAILVTMFVLAIINRIVKSRVGRAFVSIREHEELAISLGINSTGFKIMSFVVSSFFAGIAGSIYAHYLGFFSPGACSSWVSLEIIAIVIVGGMGSLWGSVIGAVFLTTLPEIFRFMQLLAPVIYGFILIIVIIFMPQGLAGGLQSIYMILRENVRWGN